MSLGQLKVKRRDWGQESMAEVTSAGEVIRFGAFELDVSMGELRERGVRLSVQGLPLQILAILAGRPGTLVTREELRTRLWSADTFVDFDHSIRNAVARLREVLHDSAEHPRYIETLPRRGYRFIAQVASPPSNGAAPAPPQAAVPPDRVTRWPSTFGLAPILLGALVAAGILTSVYIRHHGRAAPIRSLAVLPLKNLSGDPAQEYFSDGMTEALIGRLSSIRSLRVISRTSVMAFKDTHMSMPEIASRLHADALVEGSVIRQGGRVRVHAQLIRGETDEHFWSETYDRDLGDTLSLQSEVAQSIARKVEVTVTGEEQKRLSEVRPVAPEVYESYLKGESAPRNNRDEVQESIALFEEAIRKDPTFAPAYVGLAKAYENLSSIVVGGSPAELRPRVVTAARKALELDPQLAEAHVLLAEIYQRRWQWSEAEAEYRMALDLKPSDAAAHLGLANWFVCRGRIEEALAWSRRARELDPVGTSGAEIGWILFLARRYDEAIRELRSTLAVHPNEAFAHWALGFVLITKGEPNEAIPILEKTAVLMDRSPGSIELLATAYGWAGNRTEALRLIKELEQRRQTGFVPAGAFINPYLGLHDYDQAFVWFERAYQEQSSILQFLKVHPFFDPVRDDPRFADLVHRVGLD
jgi:TolB-like protein/DNA-binding winged helix-turn-helix (wHTH) protein/tetratricopeptide (TPR) repeat protein